MLNTFHFTEDSYEQSIISLFKEMGYEYHYGPDSEADTGRAYRCYHTGSIAQSNVGYQRN